MPDQPIPTLAYKRPSQSRHGLFAGRFITIASIGILLGGFLACVQVAVLLGLLLGGTSDGRAQAVECSLRLLIDLLLLAGCVGTIIRQDWARRTMIIAAGFDLFLIVIEFTTMMIGKSSSRMVIPGGLLLIIFAGWAIRLTYSLIALSLYRSAYADFYFARDDGGTPGTSGGAHIIIPTTTVPRRPTFVIRGVDRETNKETEIQSHTKTEALARRSAVMLGLDPASITIASLEAEANDSQPE